MSAKRQMHVRCDRCGEQVIGDEPKPLSSWGEIKARGDDLTIGVWGPGGGSAYADLCVECWSSFYDWWTVKAGRPE